MRRPDKLLRPEQAVHEAGKFLLNFGFISTEPYKFGRSYYLVTQWSWKKLRISNHPRSDGSLDIACHLVFAEPTLRWRVHDLAQDAMERYVQAAPGFPPDAVRASVEGYRGVREELGQIGGKYAR